MKNTVAPASCRRFGEAESTCGRRPWAAIVVVSIGCAVCYALLTARFFPSAGGMMGHDYRYFLPQLLAGEAWWRTNGWSAIPWFSPHACGGLPLLANPQSVVLSVPQLLFHLLPPARMAHVTLLGSAAIGAAASAALVRRRFAASPEAAALAAVLFLFNGFLTYRMAVGHLTYHVFGLVPLAALATLAPIGETAVAGRAAVGRACALGLMVGYFVYGGAVNYLGALGLTLLILGLLRSLRHGPQPSFLPVLAGGKGIGAAIGAMKLAPAWVFMEAFPRVGQNMTLVHNLPALLGRMVVSLFLPNLLDFSPDAPYEFENGMSFAALVLMIAAGRRRLPAIIAAGTAGRRRRHVAALGLLLMLPIAFSGGSEAWGHLLKMVPYLKNTVVPFRWWSVYIPAIAVIAALSFDEMYGRTPQRRPLWFAAIAVLVAAQAWARDGRFYDGESPMPEAPLIERPFDPRPIALLRQGGPIPPITRLDGRSPTAAAAEGWRNDLMVEGISPLPCYEPAFGYGQETFPGTALHPGDALAADAAGRLNLANPACYVYGAANGCRPGQRFTSGQIAAARAFLAYRPFPIAMPWWQTFATGVTLVTIPLAFLGLAAALMPGRHRLFHRARKQ